MIETLVFLIRWPAYFYFVWLVVSLICMFLLAPILYLLGICSGDYFRTEVICSPSFLETIVFVPAYLFAHLLNPFALVILPLMLLGAVYLVHDLTNYAVQKRLDEVDKAKRKDNPFRLLYDKRQK